MKTVTMKFGNGTREVSVPEENLLGVIESDFKVPERTEEEVVLDALANPIGTERLGQMVKPGQTVAIVVSDVTRLWQRMYFYLPYIVDELNRAGIKDEDIRFICALGYHRPLSDEEHRKLFGDQLADRFTMLDHECKDEANLVELGKTKAGTPVFINKVAMDADHLVITGCTTYHPFVGWGGGKKSIIPGIAGFPTIQHNHFMCLTEEIGGGQNPLVRNANFEGNPVHEDMMDVAAFVKPSFMFNVIMGHKGQIAYAVTGDYIEAHNKGCKIVEDLYGVPIKELGDLAISSQGGFPKDIELYQTGKAIYHTQDAIKPGGTMIVLSDCKEGLGPEDAREMFEDFDNNVDREKCVRDEFTVPRYVSYYVCSAAAKYDIIVVSNIDPERVKTTGLRVTKSVEEALELVYKEKGRDLKTYLMPQGSSTLPILQRQ